MKNTMTDTTTLNKNNVMLHGTGWLVLACAFAIFWRYENTRLLPYMGLAICAGSFGIVNLMWGFLRLTGEPLFFAFLVNKDPQAGSIVLRFILRASLFCGFAALGVVGNGKFALLGDFVLSVVCAVTCCCVLLALVRNWRGTTDWSMAMSSAAFSGVAWCGLKLWVLVAIS